MDAQNSNFDKFKSALYMKSLSMPLNLTNICFYLWTAFDGVDLGMTSGGIADSQLSASSAEDTQRDAPYARIDHRYYTIDDNYGWAPSSSSTDQWIQVCDMCAAVL